VPGTEALASPKDRVGEKLANVTLEDLEGKKVELLDFHKDEVLVVAYTGVGCPISGRYAPRLEELSKKYEKKGVRFVGINANPHDSAKKIAEDIKELGVSFPVLKDVAQDLTLQLDAKTTTEAFVVDKQGVIQYRGMVDDQYAVGAQRSRPKNKYLEDAIKDVVKGKAPFVSRTVAPGCLITRIAKDRPTTDVTYSSHIASIVANNCQQCHRPDQIAPFPLTTYEEVRGWSAMIYSVLEDDRMPPWNAHPQFDGKFVNERRMASDDRKTLMAWIDSGMARGNPSEDPQAKKWPQGWRIGKPHKVFTMKKAFKVPSEGVVDYQYFKIPTFISEDKWITAIEARAGAEDVVHHILVFLADENGEIDRRNVGLDDGYLCAMVPGDTPSIFPKGYAKKLPAGSTVVFQVHYTTNGKNRKDKCSVGMIFTDEPVEHVVKTKGYGDFSFEIPPGANDHEVRADHTFDADVEILSLYPHMHFRGKDWKYVAHYPDGRSETLLHVPTYDYNWQESYILRERIKIPKGTRLEGIAHFDNSADNFANPDPTIAVRFGEQTWDEMMIGYFDYVSH
jgi:peroxiredoxin